MKGVKFSVEKRGNTYVAVLDYPERKKNEGMAFYTNTNRELVRLWCEENSYYSGEENVDN